MPAPSAKTIAITGGTGLVGRHISRLLRSLGYKVIVFSRSPKPSSDKGVVYAVWNPAKEAIDKAALSTAGAVIHLAGAGVADKRWTPERKEEIRRSRVEATYFLHRAIAENAPGCRVFVAASATGYYGPDRKGGIPFTEDAPPYDDFLADVCKQWEAATFSAAEKYRTVALRIGIVLGKEGGAYPKLSQPMSFGVMPILGSGSQIVSWIHVEDLARLFIESVLDESYSGVYNAVAPYPVAHQVLMKAIADAKGGLKIPVPVPPFALQLILGDASVEVLKSCTVSAQKTLDQGFAFRFADIKSAAENLAGR